MPFSDLYRRQVALLLRVLPFVAEEKNFALKGGTAINLFIRDMPRLSVDIDLTYLPVQERAASLAGIDTALRRISARVRDKISSISAICLPMRASTRRYAVPLWFTCFAMTGPCSRCWHRRGLIFPRSSRGGSRA